MDLGKSFWLLRKDVLTDLPREKDALDNLEGLAHDVYHTKESGRKKV